MRKDLFLHMLDFAYPTSQLPVEKPKLHSIFTRFNKTLTQLLLTNDGKLIGQGNFICNIREGSKDFLEKAIAQFEYIEDKIKLIIQTPDTRELLYVIQELNERGFYVTNIDASDTLQTIVTFEQD